ncbi:MAG: acyltransferase [Candidatus Coatesbacteria bacterium]|nr:acyltransferase [Candidatus Coatesbacteria bacterium]
MKVGFLQFCPQRGQVKENLRTIIGLIDGQECDLWVLPELCNTGYLFSDPDEAWDLAEEIPSGSTTEKLAEISVRNRSAIVAGIAERDEDQLYNSSILVTPKGDIFRYRKLHLFGYEKEVFSPGDREPEVFNIGRAMVGMMICFDWYFPETARILMLKGAQIICHPSNLVLPYCQKSMPTRCIENRVFAITANRIGSEVVGNRELVFTGGSLIVDPLGEVLAKASEDSEEFKIVDIVPKISSDKKLTRMNELRSDRRVELYGELLRNGDSDGSE